ncbi:MAG: MFS transporter [Acidobacteria bacterium]|nr:MFS transporter [Acidobacteriota bacterium]MBV9069687.1 MFS transporter [Acidobacteriota bacterium]MBV9186944.1 MFS transporter [Acidobacteriota bacterium]
MAALKPQVRLLAFASLLNDSASEMIYPLLPVFLTSVLGATPVTVGVIEGAADGLASILKYFAGSISDKLPRRKPLVVIGYGLAAASRALIAVAGRWPSVLTARLIDRTGKGIRSAPRDAIIADVTPAEDRGRAFGFQRALDHTGAVVGPLLALLFLNVIHVPMRTLFMIAVVPGAIGVVMLAAFLKEEERPSERGRLARIVDPNRSQSGQDARAPGSFYFAITAVALFSLANSSDAFLILQAHAAGVSTAMLPTLWAAHHVIKSLFSTRAGALSDRIDRRLLLIGGWTSYAIIYAVFPFAHSLLFFVVLFVLYAIPFTLSEGAERAWISDLVPAAARGKSFGIYYLANGLCVLVGTVLFGEIYQNVSAQAAFWVGAGLAVMAAAAVLIVPRKSMT